MMIMKLSKIKKSLQLDRDQWEQVEAVSEAERRKPSAMLSELVREALATRRILKQKAA